jgi:endonuclease/exonuclease/phosphatase family metal-dependent hydrolase
MMEGPVAGHVIKVSSYNVHRCIGTDRCHDPSRVARVIRELSSDVVGLQEVSARLHGEGAIDQADYLGRQTGMDVIAGPCLVHEAGHYGNAILTRWPIERVRRHDLSVRDREPRGALEATLRVGHNALRFAVTHFGLLPGERCVQSQRLSECLHETGSPPLILLGDCNRWIPGEPSLRALDCRFGASRGRRSFPSYFPVLALDRIWVDSPNYIESITAHRSPLARRASDHLPVTACIALSHV